MAYQKNKEWQITKIANSAKKIIQSLALKSQNELLKKFENLQTNPFKNDIRKVEGKKNIYRGRLGDLRFYYRLFPESKSIEILLVDSRGHIKKKTIQRLK